MKCQYVKDLFYLKHGEREHAGYYWCDLSDNPCDHYTTGGYCQEIEDQIKEEEDGD